MLYNSYHEIKHLQTRGKERFYTVVGYICETDTFGSNRKIAEIQKEMFSHFKMQEPIALPWQVITIQDSAQQKFYGMKDKPSNPQTRNF